MRVTISRPSPMDCKEMHNVPDTAIAVVTPVRYSKKQRTVDMFPFEVLNELTNAVQDRGFISVDAKTGQLVIERRTEIVPFDTEKKPEPAKEKK